MPADQSLQNPESKNVRRDTPGHDTLGLIACGALAFVFASIGHEVIGHGGGALLTGARITLISSVYFSALGAGPISDAGGPVMNLVLGGLFLLCCQRWRPRSASMHFLLCSVTALNLFWGFGYFLYSGISKKGDWAFLVNQPGTEWVWRGGLIVIGLYGYRCSIAAVRKIMLPFAESGHGEPAPRPLFRAALVLYVAAGLTSTLSALVYRGPVGPALSQGALQSFGAFIGLYVVARGDVTEAAPGTTVVVRRNWGWIVVSMLVVAAYFAVLGRGYVG